MINFEHPEALRKMIVAEIRLTPLKDPSEVQIWPA